MLGYHVKSHSSFHSRNVCFNSEASSLHWKSKLRNAWGQYKRVSTLQRGFRTHHHLAVVLQHPFPPQTRLLALQNSTFGYNRSWLYQGNPKHRDSIPSSLFDNRITQANFLQAVLNTDITSLVAVVPKHFVSTTCPYLLMSSTAAPGCCSSAGEWYYQAMPLQEDHTIHSRCCLLQEVLDNGITSLAVVLKHSFLFPEHEEQVGALAKSMGFTQISLSSEVMPMVKMVPRGYTAAADAYLTPHIMKYVRRQVLS